MAATTLIQPNPYGAPIVDLTNSPTNPEHGFGGSVLVVDPMSRKLSIPYEYVQETKAAQRIGIASLCMLFLQGRCRQGTNCHQVHADPNVIFKLREQARQYLMCCGVHGDPNALPEMYRRFYIKIQGGSGTVIPMSRVAFTQGLHRLLDEHAQAHMSTSTRNSPSHPNRKATECDIVGGDNGLGPTTADIIIAPVQIICRLHGQDRCRFSEDCKFLHLCKELLWTELSVAAPSTPPRRFSSGGMSGYYANGAGAPPPPPGPFDAPPPPFRPSYPRGQNGMMFAPSNESLGSMDLSPTPPLTPTTPKHFAAGLGQGPHAGAPLRQLSPVALHGQSPRSPQSPASSVTTVRGQSFSYEPYAWNPFALPPSDSDTAAQ